MSAEKTFNELRAKVREAQAAREELRYKLDYKYGRRWYSHDLTRGELKKWEALGAKLDKAENAFFAMLDTISPRDFRRGFPVPWVLGELTYADATTRGPLAAVAPPSMGYYPSDMARLSQAVPAEAIK